MIFFTLHQQHRRLHLLHIADRRQRVVQRLIVPRLAVELKFREPLCVAAAIPIGPVRDGPIGLDGLEAISFGGNPRGHEAAVRPASCSHLRAVHVGTRSNDIDSLHEVVVVFHAPASTRAVGEVGAIAARPTRIGEQHEHALRGEILEFVEPAFPVRRVRPAVNVDHHGILLARRVSVGLHQPPFDFQIPDALVREALGITPRHVLVHVVIEVRELTLPHAVGRGHEQLRGLRHRR